MDKIFSSLRKEIADKDAAREAVIVGSRPITKDAKVAIYSMHRGGMDEAESVLKRLKTEIADLRKKNESASETGSYSQAAQEYAEAMAFLIFLKEQRLATREEIGVEAEDYLLGICDLTGELERRAVFSVVNDHFDEVRKIKDFVSGIYEEFLKFDLRNSELRKKSDSIKWNLKRIDEILYDLKVRGKI
jgi:translin